MPHSARNKGNILLKNLESPSRQQQTYSLRRKTFFSIVKLLFSLRDTNLVVQVFFFYQGFLSLTLTIHRTAGEERGPSFIPLYYFHPLTNIQTFICNFAREVHYHIFLTATLLFTRLLLDEIYQLIELLFDSMIM